MPSVLAAGFPDELTSWLGRQLDGVTLLTTRSGEQTLDELSQRDWSMLIIDQSVSGPSGTEVVSQARSSPRLARLPVVYCVEKGTDGDLPKALLSNLGVDHIFFHPLDRERLALHVAELLGLSSRRAESDESQAQQKTRAKLERV